MYVRLYMITVSTTNIDYQRLIKTIRLISYIDAL